MARGNLIIDLSYGSTGKGLLAGYLAKRDQPDTILTAWAANAGHTFIDKGRTFIHTMLANGVVSPRLKTLMLGPGSLIDPANLMREMANCADLLADVRVMIHPQAVVIQQRHRDEEAGFHAIGSTKKGVGAAMIERIRRDPSAAITAKRCFGPGHELSRFVCTPEQWTLALENAQRVQVEGAQGFGLSMYHGHYPYTTSRDVTTAQMIADCAMPWRMVDDMVIWGTARTYPIRVANRFDALGNQIGWSGPCEDDQTELDWRDLGMEAELTTVTKLPRRIFTFSESQIAAAVKMNGVHHVFLNFVNYCKSDRELRTILEKIEKTGALPTLLGLGPTCDDVVRTIDFHARPSEDRFAVYRKVGVK